MATAPILAVETVGQALADAGFPGGQGLSGDRAGVIIGTTLAGPGAWAAAAQPCPAPVAARPALVPVGVPVHGQRRPPVLTAETMPGARAAGEADAGTIAGQICERFGLRGAGHTVDGSRFSSLLAVAAACSALAAGDLDFALAGGVETGPDHADPAGPAGDRAPAPDEMRARDAGPAGSLPADGCGVVALMRAHDAQAAGVPSYAEISGWGMSADGGAAGPHAQRTRTSPALRRACQRARINASTARLIIDIGRTRSARPIAGVVKAALAVASGSQRLAEVSAMGLGGGHANLLLRAPATPAADTAADTADAAADTADAAADTADGAAAASSAAPAPAAAKPRPSRRPSAAREAGRTAAQGAEVYALSGDDTGSLIATLNRIAEIAPHLSGRERRDLASQLGRKAQDGAVRVAFAVESANDPGQLAGRARQAARLLADLRPGVLHAAAGVYAGSTVRGRAVLLFPGGQACPEPDAVASDGAGHAATTAAIHRASRGALRWLDRLHLAPVAGIGHGPGEITGLAWAGCISAEDTARLITERDQIIRRHRPGDADHDAAMLDLAADAVTSRALCAGTDLVIAAYNGPRAHVLAGSATGIRTVARRAAADGIRAAISPVSQAFHSPAMAACAAAFRPALSETRFGPPRRRLISTISGRELDQRDNIPVMLADQLTVPVRFLEAVRAVARDTDVFCAAGPGAALAGLASECWPVPAVVVPGDTVAAGGGTNGTAINGTATNSGATNGTGINGTATNGSASNGSASNGSATPGSVTADGGDGERGDGGAEGAPGFSAATAAAALFAAGAIPGLEPLFAGRPARPINIWRDQVFISRPPTPPSENGPSRRDQDEHSGEDTGRNGGNPGEHPGKDGSGRRTLDGRGTPGIPESPPAPRRSWIVMVQQPTGSRRGVNARMPDVPGPAGPPEEPGLWARCFTEVLRPLGHVRPAAGGPWRVRVAGREPFGIDITETFGEGALAGTRSSGDAGSAGACVLCYVADPGDPGAADALLDAGEEAAACGGLVVITHGPGLAGFCQSLRAARPGLGITLLRVPATAAGVRAARPFAAAEHGTYRELVLPRGEPTASAAGPAAGPAPGPATVSIEPVAAGADGIARPPGWPQAAPAMPAMPAMPAAPAAPNAPNAPARSAPIGPTDVILVTGGTGGTELACAEALGGTGAAVVLIGRDHPVDHPGLRADLDRLRKAGACAGYESADLTDAADTAEAIGRLEQRLGRVTAVVHVAGIGAPVLRGGRPGGGSSVRRGEHGAGGMDGLLGPVTGALSNVLRALEHRRLRLVVTFGSVAGQYGSAGGERYALASGALRNHAERLSERLPGCRVLHVDWPLPPADAPAGTERPGTERPGTGRPGMDAGRVLLQLLTTPGTPDAVIVHEPSVAATAPVGGRFLESVLVHYPGAELVAETRLSLATDPYLSDHRRDDVTVLPAVMGLEAMAEAASALAGRPLSRATGIVLGNPVVVPEDRPAAIRVYARNEGGTVETVLCSAETGYRAEHCRALFPLGALPHADTGRPYSPGGANLAGPRSGDGAEHLLDGMTAGIVDGTELYGPLRIPAGRFRRVAFLPALTSRSCRALLRGTDDEPWFGPQVAPLITAPLLLGSPGVNDAAMHVLQACVPHRRLVPVGCDSLNCSGAVISGAVEVRAGERFAGGGEYVWDVQAVDGDGRAVASWTGLRLRDAGPLRRSEPWSPMLLAVYLERGLTALGLDPGLRVTIRAGHPRQAAGIPVRSGSTGATDDGGEMAGSETPREGEGTEAVAGIYAITAGPAATGSRVAGDGGARLGSVLYPAAGAGGRAHRSHLDGLTLMVDGAFPAACEWEGADRGRNAGGEDWAEDLGPGLGALYRQLLERCGEPAAMVGTRISTAVQCLSKTGRRGGPPPVLADIATPMWPGPAGTDSPDGPGGPDGTAGPDGAHDDGRWVLLRAGDAAIASTVIEIDGVTGPVAVAIMARAAAAAG